MLPSSCAGFAGYTDTLRYLYRGAPFSDCSNYTLKPSAGPEVQRRNRELERESRQFGGEGTRLARREPNVCGGDCGPGCLGPEPSVDTKQRISLYLDGSRA